MSIFKRKKEEEYEEDLEELEVKDLKPQHSRKRKELPKPWGKRERYTVLAFLLITVVLSALLSASSRNWKLPGLPQINLPNFSGFSFDFLKGETIVIGNKKGDQLEFEKKNLILSGFRDMTRNLSGTYAIFVVNLASGYSFGENQDKILTAASLIKLPVIAALYIDSEEGLLNLDDKAEGSNLTYRNLVKEMGLRSNNQAQVTIVNILGKEKIQTVIDNLGMEDTSYLKNETTAYDIGLFFQKLWDKEIVSEVSRDEILGYLTDTIYEDWIKKGIPDNRVAHKYGRELNVISDAGIVFTEKPFVLVIMSQGIIESEANLVIPEIASLVFNELK